MRTGLQTHQAVNSRWQEVTAGELPGDKEEASLTQGQQARTHGPEPSMCGSELVN